MAHLWTIARWLGDALFAPFAWIPPPGGMIVLSAVCGVLLLLAFRVLTPQRRLKRVKDLMSSTIYEMRLFSAYPGHVIRAQGRAILLTARYLFLALPSFVVMVPLVGLLLLRVSLVYEVRPLQVGERARVSIMLQGGAKQEQVFLEARGGGLKVIHPVVMLDGEAHARVEGLKEGRHTLVIELGGEKINKEVAVGGGGNIGISPVRAKASSWTLLLSREDPLPSDGPISSITVHHAEQSLAWLGLPWWLHLLIISMVVALALRRRLGVVF